MTKENSNVTSAIVVDSIRKYLHEVNHEIDDSLAGCLIYWEEEAAPLFLTQYEYIELQQHIWSSLNSRYTKKQKNNNLIQLINYKLSQEMDEYNTPDLQLDEVTTSPFYDSSFWNGLATIEESYKGNAPFMVVLIGQKHEFYHTEAEKRVIRGIQDNIIDIQNKLYQNGVKAFAYEGGSFKEKSSNIPTNLTYEQLTELYEKKCEVEFEENNDDIYSYGIESLLLHRRADSLFTNTYIIEKYAEFDSSAFPMDTMMLFKKLTSYLEQNTEDFQLSNLKLQPQRIIDTVASFFSGQDSVTFSDINSLCAKTAKDANNVILNERNRVFANNLIELHDMTRVPIIALKLGVNHLRLHPFFEKLGLNLERVQDILKEQDVSFIYLMPDSVNKYLDIEFDE